MLHVPARFAMILVAFARCLCRCGTWRHAQRLMLGALLVPGQRTVCSIGLRQERRFVTYHQVLNRAIWDNRLAARLLLRLLVEAGTAWRLGVRVSRGVVSRLISDRR
jgi:hypothetical protein